MGTQLSQRIFPLFWRDFFLLPIVPIGKKVRMIPSNEIQIAKKTVNHILVYPRFKKSFGFRYILSYFQNYAYHLTSL